MESNDSFNSRFITLLTRKPSLCIQDHRWILFRYILSNSTFLKWAVTAFLIDAAHASLVRLTASFAFSKDFMGTSWNLDVPFFFDPFKKLFDCWMLIEIPFLYARHLSLCLLQKRNGCHWIYIFWLKGLWHYFGWS